MNAKQLLQFKIADMILEVADAVELVDRSDLQGMASATAQKIIELVDKSPR